MTFKRKVKKPIRYRLQDLWWNFTLQSSIMIGLLFVMLALFVMGQFDLLGMESRLANNAVIDVMRNTRWLPALILGVPTIGGVSQAFVGGRTCHRRDLTVVVTTFFTVALVLLAYPGTTQEGLRLSLPWFMGLGIHFHIDMLAFTMLLLTSILWFLVMIYGHEYMKHEKRCTRFSFFMAITYASVLGTIMSADLLTMFLFFEIMTIASYMLVIHAQKESAYSAGYNYIFMGLLGGFAILIALLLVVHYVGDLQFVSAIEALSNIGNMRYVIIGLLFLGFGVKAGMAPVHVWLPRAHPVAPTPASALLSGVMIKVGAFGMLRVATSYYFPASADAPLDLWQTSEAIGAATIWIGIITMAIGVFMALQQANIKRMLAYHSISQMGYIVMGIGVALYLGNIGAMGFTGALYHIINHALFKSLLFMVAGVIYLKTRESDMYKMGGLLKVMPITAFLCLIAILGITGMPLFNGYISKTILHHGIVEAYEYGHGSFYFAEFMFTIISAGTAASFIKLFYYVFLKRRKTPWVLAYGQTKSMHMAMGVIAIFIVALGVLPYYVLESFILVELDHLSYDPVFINRYIHGMAFFTLNDIFAIVIAYTLGLFIFLSGKKWHLFHLKLPAWLRVDYLLMLPLNWALKQACKRMDDETCRLDLITKQKVNLKGSEDVGFLERFIITTNLFTRRYETPIIKSDAFIFSVVLTIVLIYMLIITI